MGAVSDNVKRMALIETEERLSEVLNFKHDEDAFAAIARAHGFDEATLMMLAQLEYEPEVTRLFEQK